MSDKPREKKTLKIVSCTELRKGKSPAGKEWTIYQVAATNADGIPIDQELRSWTKLEVTDKPADFEVEVGEYQGTPQFTLHPIRTKKLPERIEDCETRILELTERVARLEAAASGAADETGGAQTASTPDAGGVW